MYKSKYTHTHILISIHIQYIYLYILITKFSIVIISLIRYFFYRKIRHVVKFYEVCLDLFRNQY
jgi:hypothetical protein